MQILDTMNCLRLHRSAAPFLLGVLLLCGTVAASQQHIETELRPPPEDNRVFKPADLVELTTRDTSIHLDVRYAGTNNFMHRAMYSEARVFLQRPAAVALLRVQRALVKHGFGLLVFDAYRPWSVTRAFWLGVSGANRNFVADPRRGSIHNRGCAVDLSLYDLKTGQEVEMPSPFDEFSKRAHPDYRGGTALQRSRRDFLRTVMEHEGFTVNKGEWWHFDYKDWRAYRILDIPFSQIAPGPGRP